MVIRSLVSLYISLMVICSLATTNKSSKTKETVIQKQIVEMLQQERWTRTAESIKYKKRGKYKIGMMKFLALTLYLPARLT